MAGVARRRQGIESKENSPLWTHIMGKVPMVALFCRGLDHGDLRVKMQIMIRVSQSLPESRKNLI